MKEALDLKSKSGVHRLISALEERGFIRRLPNRARALEILRQPEDATGPARAAERAATAPRPAPVVAPVASAPRATAPAPANDIIEIPMHGRIAACLPPCWARANITHSKFRAIPWWKPAFWMVIWR